MSCPACGQALTSGQERCASCGAVVAPAVEGALAPDPGSLFPPPRGRADALRDIPGHRKRSWKDEVKDRVRNRRQRRPSGMGGAGPELPLFEGAAANEEPVPAATAGSVAPPAPLSVPLSVEDTPLFRVESGPEARPSPRDTQPIERNTRPIARAEPHDEDVPEVVDEAELTALPRPSSDLADLPLRPASGAPSGARDEGATSESARRSRVAPRIAAPSLDDDEPLSSGADDEWPLELPEQPREAPAVERPAFARERAYAAGLDFALMLVTAALVVYFAGRAARVPVTGLFHAWPWLLGYLAFLGLVYAGYFTGTTGQTLGKMATGLRVVDRAGHPPGFLRAFGRGLLGAVGVALAGLGLLPILFDPARRALHDRLFGMRVIRR